MIAKKYITSFVCLYYKKGPDMRLMKATGVNLKALRIAKHRALVKRADLQHVVISSSDRVNQYREEIRQIAKEI